MSIRLHMSFEVDDKDYFHKTFYVTPNVTDPVFLAGEGVKILHKLMKDEVKNYFKSQRKDL